MSELTENQIVWHNDGHQIAVWVEWGELKAGVLCPHSGMDWSKVPWADRPNCRRGYQEDGTEDPQDHGYDCQFDLYVDDDRLENDSRTEISRVPVEYCWHYETVEMRAVPS